MFYLTGFTVYETHSIPFALAEHKSIGIVNLSGGFFLLVWYLLHFKVTLKNQIDKQNYDSVVYFGSRYLLQHFNDRQNIILGN